MGQTSSPEDNLALKQAIIGRLGGKQKGLRTFCVDPGGKVWARTPTALDQTSSSKVRL